MKIPKWATAAVVNDQMRLEVLRDIKRNSKPRQIIHCKCGRGCRKCYGELHCGCRFCYRAEKRPRALSTGDLEQEYFPLGKTESLDTNQPGVCVAQAVLHEPKSTWAESTKPVVKICLSSKAQAPLKQTKFFCQICNMNICSLCFLSTCSVHNVIFLGSNRFVCQSAMHTKSK